ncbi:MAG TPA: Ig-like domain-containing protein, partial [Polyangium sp.]|nr:Ig-like domain-containing protein [Polyangium sp.]
MRYRRSSVALLLAASASCVPGATVKPPYAPVRSELVPVLGTYAAPKIDEPLRVVFASPQNQVAESPEITVVFNQPMRRLGDESPAGAAPMVVRPAVPGKTSWVGTTALRFIPDKPLAKAATFNVEIPKGITSAAGKVLEESFRFSFTTEKPRISGSEPENKASSVALAVPITLYLNQPVSAAEVLRTVTITANKKAVPFDVPEVDAEHVVLKPRAELPRNTEIVVRVDASLKGTEGEAPMGETKEITFRTLGPFVLSSVVCAPHPQDKGACDPNQNDVTLRVTNLLAVDAWEQAIFVEPTLDSFGVYETGDEENGTPGLTLTGSFEPGKTYTVGVRPKVGGKPLVDAHGQAVGPQKTFTLRFGDLPAEVTFGASGIYWEPGPHRLPVGVLNTPEATVTMLPLRRDEVLARLLGGKAPPAALQGAKQRVFKGGKTNESNWERFEVEDLLPTRTTKGPMVARASYLEPGRSEPSVVEREMQVTNIGLLTKISPEDAVVWATALSDGSAIAGAKVDLYALPNKGQATLISSSKADAGGLAFLPLRLGQVRPENVAVVVERGEDWVYQTLQTPPVAEPAGLVFTGRGIYRPGENVQIKGVVRQPKTTGLFTPKEGDVLLRLVDSERREAARMPAKLTKFGTFNAEMTVPADASLGFYYLYAEVLGGRMGTRVTVDEYRPIESRAFATINKESFVAGERLTCVARGEQLYGAPMVGADVKVVMTRTAGYYDIPGFEASLIGMQDYFAPMATVHQASGQLD